MAILMKGPRGAPVMVLTLTRRPCANCGRRARLTLLPNYYDRSGARWCLRCVRERYPAG